MSCQQHQAELGRLRLGKVGQFSVGRSRPGQADPQLGDAEHPGQEGADDVDRLDTGQRQATQSLRMSPVSMRSVSPSKRQRVTIQCTYP